MNETLLRARVVARFPTRRYGEREHKNFQTCDLVWEGNPEKQSPLAGVVRTRKTKRSLWKLEVRLYASIGWASPSDMISYFNAIAAAANDVRWPEVPTGDVA